MSINHSFGLNLRVLSFELSPSLYKYNDDLRVSITTIPEENKQHFTISARKMKDCHLTFGVNVEIPQENLPEGFISTATEKIILVIRRKSFFDSDPIIASTIIPMKDFPKNLSQPPEIKTINLYEKVKKEESSRNSKNNYGIIEIHDDSKNLENRRIVGRMQIQMSLTDPFHLKEFGKDCLFDLDNGVATNDEYIDEQFKIGENYYGFKILD